MLKKDHSPPLKATSDKGLFSKRSPQLLWIAATLIILLTFLLYTPALRNDFVNWDDAKCIYENTHIRSLDGTSLHWMITSFHGGNWHPLTWLSHALVYHFWELNPTMHHLANIIVHTLNTLLVFFLALRIVTVINASPHIETSIAPQAILASSVTALLFGLHPLNVESVAWATERKGLLSTFFVLLSLLSYLSYTSTIRKQSRLRWFCLSLMSFIFALMSKPIAVTLPVTLLLIDIFPLKRIRWGLPKQLMVFLEKIPFFIFSIASAILTTLAQHSSDALVSLQLTDITMRMLNALVTIVFYLEKLVWPLALVPFYPFTGNVFNAWSVVSGILILAISGFSLEMTRRGNSCWLVAWLYYVITLLPTLSIIQIGSHAAADRFTYLPRLSLFLAVGIGVSWLWTKASTYTCKVMLRGLLLGCISAVVFFLSCLTTQQIQIWHDSEVLWSHVTSVFPKTAPLAHMNLGSVYLEKGKLDEAIAEFKQVIAIKPRHTGAYTNLGVVYSRKNRLDEAIAVYKQALAINPDSEEAHINLGTAYGKKGMLDEAIAEFEQTLEINPECAKAYYNIGAAYWEKGMLDNAITEYTKALDINPYYAKAYYKLGLAFEAQHSLQEAIGAYHEAIRLKLDNHEVYNNLAWIYATAPDNTMRDGKEAVKLAIKACELTDFKNAVPLDTIAAAYAEHGNFSKAVEYQSKAIKLAPPLIKKEFQERLQLYKSGKPYRAQHD